VWHAGKHTLPSPWCSSIALSPCCLRNPFSMNYWFETNQTLPLLGEDRAGSLSPDLYSLGTRSLEHPLLGVCGGSPRPWASRFLPPFSIAPPPRLVPGFFRRLPGLFLLAGWGPSFFRLHLASSLTVIGRLRLNRLLRPSWPLLSGWSEPHRLESPWASPLGQVLFLDVHFICVFLRVGPVLQPPLVNLYFPCRPQTCT
jgi:hypothetical protein